MSGLPNQWDCRAELIPWTAAQAAWVLAALPPSVSDDIDAAAPLKGGFGSVRVTATIGVTTWSTSVFPDSERGCYVLPVKKSVRVAEGVELGDTVTLHVALGG